MLCAVLITAMVSPAEGLPVVRSVTTPVSDAAIAVAAYSIMQHSIKQTADERVRSVLVREAKCEAFSLKWSRSAGPVLNRQIGDALQ